MEIIDYKDIDFSLWKKASSGVGGDMYEYNDMLFKKIFSPYRKDWIFEKFCAMKALNIDGLLLPDKYVFAYIRAYGEVTEHFKGYIVPKLKDYVTIDEYAFASEEFNVSDIFKAVKRASSILRDAHNKGIIMGDLSFGNILMNINNPNEVAFIDFDECSFKKYSYDTYSGLLSSFLSDYHHLSHVYCSQRTDRISMILALINVLFQKDIYLVTNEEYQTLAEQINTLKNLKQYVDILCSPVPGIKSNDYPYLDEIIDDNDDYVIKIGNNKSLS